MRLRYEADARKAAAPAATSGAVPGLRPWREVIVPHDDVAQGRYGLAEFAADLHQVASGSGGARPTRHRAHLAGLGGAEVRVEPFPDVVGQSWGTEQYFGATSP